MVTTKLLCICLSFLQNGQTEEEGDIDVETCSTSEKREGMEKDGEELREREFGAEDDRQVGEMGTNHGEQSEGNNLQRAFVYNFIQQVRK